MASRAVVACCLFFLAVVGKGEPVKVSPSLRIGSIEAFRARKGDLRHCVLRGLDLRSQGSILGTAQVDAALFLGCRLPDALSERWLGERGAVAVGPWKGLPMDPFRSELYTVEELARRDGRGVSLDGRICAWYRQVGGSSPDSRASLAQRFHDHAMDEALFAWLASRPSGRVVGIMGGHGLRRDSLPYWRSALSAWLLTREGRIVVSGGGSGIMEAANLGAYFAGRGLGELRSALRFLKSVPDPHQPGHREKAFEVIRRWPGGRESLALSTFAYGADDDNPFATVVGKYFVDAQREDRLLGIARGGVIFAPGSAGTVQEVFQDGSQNHYRSYGSRSPMLFLGREFWEGETAVWEALRRFAQSKGWGDGLWIGDDPRKALRFLMEHGSES